MFIPVPPKISFPIITAKAVETAIIHRGGFHRHNHRDQQAGYQKTFVDFMSADLGHGKFDAQSYDIGYDNHRQHFPQTVEKQLAKTGVGQETHRFEVLEADVVNTEKQGRYQRHDHHNHRSFQIHGVTDVGAGTGRAVRHEKEKTQNR